MKTQAEGVYFLYKFAVVYLDTPPNLSDNTIICLTSYLSRCIFIIRQEYKKSYKIWGEFMQRADLDTQWVDAARLTVIVGHFGSGKTEVAVNLALALAKRGYPFALADLDVVDPYFRSRECKDLLVSHGGQLIASSQTCLDADVPSMPPEVSSLFDNPAIYGVLDSGGDASGARVLARYRRQLMANNARVLCVINANRPLTDTPEKAEKYLRDIAQTSGLSINGIINNTHLCGQTELQDILTGAELTAKVSSSTGIPVVCHAVPRHLEEDVSHRVNPVFPLRLYMKKPWE